jgi:hypothetical protein
MSCAVCGAKTAKRCGKCKAVHFCGAECQRKGWPEHKSVCGTLPTSLRAAGAPVVVLPVQLDELHRQGWCVIKLPPGLREPLLAAWSAFFARPSAYKNTFRAPSPRGTYLTPHPGLHETFESKRGNVDPAFRCPPECEAATRAMFEWCEETALGVLRQLLEHVARRGKRNGEAAWEWTAGEFEPDSTLRVLHYDRVSAAVPLEQLEAAFPDHTDSSLVTLAPRSTMAALEMKRFDTGAWECVEEHMRDPDDCVVFMGDSGAYLTNNYFPSPLHRPGSRRMCEDRQPGTRISTPFFLRGAERVVLRPDRLCGCALPPLTVAQVSSNVGLCRDRMPWKANAYYASLNYS